jgi:HEAT repeat protein
MSYRSRCVSSSQRPKSLTICGHSCFAGLIGTCLIVVLATPAALAESPKLDAIFQSLAKLKLGQDLTTLRPIEQAISRSHADPSVRAALEAHLIETLKGKATDLGKDYACRQLALVGSDDAVPVLAGLLPNQRLSYMARYALEGIASPAAVKSLRESIGKTAGRQQLGAVISLGRLADPEAVPTIAALLGHEDNELRLVAVVALGRIGTVPAAEALQAFASKSSANRKNAIVNAQLQAVEQLCRHGEYAAAVRLCKSLESDPSERVRATVFRGLIAASQSKATATIIAGLAAEEPWKRAVAADCLVAVTKPEEIQAVAAAVPGLPVAGKIAAFVALKHRPAIRQSALKSLNSPDTEVRVAALEALIASATAQDVAVLADLAATCQDAPVRDAAFETLRLMTAEGINRAIISLMSNKKTLTPSLVRCALGRRSTEFTPGFLKAAASPNESVRLEAFRALEIMAAEKDAVPLVALLCKTSPGKEREAAGRAVWMSCRKIHDPARQAAPLLAAIETTDAAGQCALLPSLARLGGTSSLAAVHNAMQSKDQAVRDAGYRALANWPDASVADELLDVAKTSQVPSYQIWALRAYARVVSLPSGRPPKKTFEMLTVAMKLAGRPEDKLLIVSRLGSVRAPKALDLLVSYLDDPKLSSAAVPAVFTLAKGLSQSHPQQAKTALVKVRPMTKDPAVLQQISRVLHDIEAREQEQKK